MQNKTNLLLKPILKVERLSKIASLLQVAIWRQVYREREKNKNNSLDSCFERSVNAAATKHGG